jgi:hypothetical protein
MNNSIFKNNKVANSTIIANAKNITNKSRSFKFKTFFIILLSIVLLLIVAYLVISIIIYYLTKCEEKKSLFQYLFDLSDKRVCLVKDQVPLDDKLHISKIEKIPLFEKKEVFHIANQDYTYEQSKCKCASYGARLAKKEELVDSFNNGANWCTYGWTEGQSAYYPVQKCDWDNLQKENKNLPDKVKRYCGVPGLNGGFFPNPDLKFGVNCYGKKPKGNIPNPPQCEEAEFCKLPTNYGASNMLDTDEIASFNSKKWNK